MVAVSTLGQVSSLLGFHERPRVESGDGGWCTVAEPPGVSTHWLPLPGQVCLLAPDMVCVQCQGLLPAGTRDGSC